MFALISVCFVLLNSLHLGLASCEDSTLHFRIYELRQIKNCAWVGDDINERCDYNAAREHCKATCGLLCDDVQPSSSQSLPPSYTPTCVNTDDRFKIPSFNPDKKFSCQWVLRKKTDERCENFQEARENCPLACNLCDDDELVSDVLPSFPSSTPSLSPSNSPTPDPTHSPTSSPSSSPSKNPTVNPTKNPTPDPTANPTPIPTPNPTSSPTPNPTSSPTPNPTSNPTRNPTPNPTSKPTPNPTSKPTINPLLKSKTCAEVNNGYIPKNSCKQFQLCTNGAPSGALHECPDGNLFDGNIMGCKPFYKVWCDGVPPTGVPMCPSDFTGPMVFDDCSAFRHCKNGIMDSDKLYCPPGQLFDMNLNPPNCADTSTVTCTSD